MDPRYTQLAKLLTGYSTQVGKGQRVFMQLATCVPDDMSMALMDAVRERGGIVLEPNIVNPRLAAYGRIGRDDASHRVDASAFLTRVFGCDAYIDLRGYINPNEDSIVPAQDAETYNQVFRGWTVPERVDHKKWVLTVWPTTGFAQRLGVSTKAAEDFFFGACLADYPKMARDVKPLKRLMERTNMVRIQGPNDTNIAFSIKGNKVVPCIGERNVPDGELYSVPVLDSVNGIMHYNTATQYSGASFSGIRLVFRKGKIVEATCDTGDTKRLNQILDTDEGARYIGEFSLGLNWGVTRLIGDTLFDEKVGGTLHFTPGKAYKDCPNGMTSAIHWDIVHDQREAAGGGTISFDGKIIRRNGLFVPKFLHGLNPKAA